LFFIKLSNMVDKNTTKIIYDNLQKIQYFSNKLKNSNLLYIQKQNLIIDNIENKLTLLNPKNILKRGYSITTLNGKTLKNINEINENDELITELLSGFVRSKVEEKYKK
jgi:exodeoxyribonuclease VII large subunit